MKNKIRQKLLKESETDYQKFSSALIPNINNVLGVRYPKLRKIAKEIYKNNLWEQYLEISDYEFMEEMLLKAMIIGLLKKEPEKICEYIRNFVPKINNWAVCDTFCAGLKFTKFNKELVWNFVQPYLKTGKEYDIRFAVVMMLNYFVDEKYIHKVFDKLDEIKSDDYYAKMAVAWAVSVCFAKFPSETLEYLKHSNLSVWIYNKSIQKCIESYRVSKEMKETLKKMRR